MVFEYMQRNIFTVLSEEKLDMIQIRNIIF